MDFDNESLIRCFVDEEEEKKIIEWCNENDHKRSDIFEYRLEEADKLREDGNLHYKEGDCLVALQRYFAAIWHLDFDIGQQWNMMDHHSNDLNRRKLKVVSNCCAAYLKQQDWVNTKKAAEVGIRHMKKSELEDKEAEAKFLYRKGFANLQRGFCEDAVDSLKKADALVPGDRQVRQALVEATRGSKTDKVKEKEVWKNRLLSESDKNPSAGRPDGFLTRWRLVLHSLCGRRKTKAS